MQVALGGGQVAVSEQLGQRGQINTGLQQMRGKGVAQAMNAAPFWIPARSRAR